MKKILINFDTKFREICSIEVKVTQYDKISITADMIKEWSIIQGKKLLTYSFTLDSITT